MDYKTWNRLQPGDLVFKCSNKAVVEFIKVQEYRRGRPYCVQTRALPDANGEVYHLYKWEISDLLKIDYDSNEYKVIKVLYGAI